MLPINITFVCVSVSFIFSGPCRICVGKSSSCTYFIMVKIMTGPYFTKWRKWLLTYLRYISKYTLTFNSIQQNSKYNINNNDIFCIWAGVCLLCKEEGGVFSALREGDGEESQGDVHLPGIRGQFLRLKNRKIKMI